jgi:hypothetical protein
MLYLVHETPEVLLNLEAQLLDILLKQGLLLPRGEGRVVCSALRVLAQLCLPILTRVHSMYSAYIDAPQLHDQSETDEQHHSISRHLVLPNAHECTCKTKGFALPFCQPSFQSPQMFS